MITAATVTIDFITISVVACCSNAAMMRGDDDADVAGASPSSPPLSLPLISRKAAFDGDNTGQ